MTFRHVYMVYSAATSTNLGQRQSTPANLRLNAIENGKDNEKHVAEPRVTNDNHGDSTTDESDRDDVLSNKNNRAPAKGLDLAMRQNGYQYAVEPSLPTEIDAEEFRTPTSKSTPGSQVTHQPSASPPEQHSHLGFGTSNEKAISLGVSGRKEPLNPAKPKHKLGKVGGKPKEKSAGTDSRSSHEEQGNISTTAHSIQNPDRIPDNNSQSPNQAAEAIKPAVQDQQKSPGRLSEEQANENRKRLQQDLERMSKATVKKKRRF